MQTFGQRLERVIEEKKIRIMDIADNVGISRGGGLQIHKSRSRTDNIKFTKIK